MSGRTAINFFEGGPWKGSFQQVVIILSTGRTGTQALAHFLDDAYPTVTALHEPKPTRHLRLLSNRAAEIGLPPDLARLAFAVSRRRLLQNITTPVYIESNWYLYGFLDVIKEAFDRPRILHVVRDPRTFIRSAINFGTFRGVKKVFSTFVPYWYLQPPIKGSAVERLAWHWRTVNRTIDRGNDLFGKDYFRVKYEALFAHDGTGIDRLVSWLGLPRSDKLLGRVRAERPNASTANPLDCRDDLASKIRRSLLDLCGDQMSRYGYSARTEEAVKTSSDDAGSIIAPRRPFFISA